MLSDVTPLILTGNEEPNIARTLAQLAWAREVVVVDSMSSDHTVAIARSFPNVRLLQRPLDTLAAQWSWATTGTGITTPWVLTLDADYFVPDAFVRELETLQPPAGVAAYRARFRYAIQGHPLRGSLYPPREVLLRLDRISFRQDGHAQRNVIDGTVVDLREALVHDDWKGLGNFLIRQHRYMTQEAEKVLTADRQSLNFAGRIRRLRVVAPGVVFFYTLLAKGCLFDGWPGWYYALERTVAELILSMVMIDRDLRR